MKLGSGICLSFLMFFFSPAAMAVNEPPYSVLKSQAPFEIREYPGFAIAQTKVNGGFDLAGSTGFRRIAGYIFGKNSNALGEVEKIAMTAPVTMVQEGDDWHVHFVMPQGYDVAHLPKPLDAGVELRDIPKHRRAVVRFSGFTTQSSIENNTNKLKRWLALEGLEFTDLPEIARYDDPFTLPWNRRNEIMLPLK